MIIEIGHFALVLAFALSLAQSGLSFWGGRNSNEALMGFGGNAARVVFLCVVLAFVSLTIAYVRSDFSVLNVLENSHSAKPLIYKITGVWGNHEGSMLLWVLILSLFGALVAFSSRSVPKRLQANTLAVQATVTAAFIAFILFFSNPFLRSSGVRLEGNDLNPLLQDPGLAIHPPLLYLGYVGSSIAFSFAIAALIEGRADPVWARAVRPWILLAWIFLTLGNATGSYWAYYELGWGGWWFWDPVENASFMPWLACTALLHSVIVMEKRDALKVWTILLAVLTFSLSLLGTFIVRSGLLTSVHAFAVDPARGLVILGMLIVFIGGSLALFAWRSPLLRPGGVFAPISREGALVVNNLLITTACTNVLVGTLYPIVLEALTAAKISVGPPYFNATFLPMAFGLLAVLPPAQSLAWKRGNLLGALQRLYLALGLAIALTVAAVTYLNGGPALAFVWFVVGLFLILGSIADLFHRVWAHGTPVSVALRRGEGLPRSVWGMSIAHASVGIVVIGIAAQAWSIEYLAIMKPGDMADLGPFQLRFEAYTPRSGPNYQEDVARFTISRGDRPLGSVEPMKRLYLARGVPTTEAGIKTVGLSQIYISLGVPQAGGVSVHMYWKPFVVLIWLGAVLMALGGAIALTDRRLRVAVQSKARFPSSGSLAPSNPRTGGC